MAPTLTSFAAPRPCKGPLRVPGGSASFGTARQEAI
jgi:hypothetical protein